MHLSSRALQMRSLVIIALVSFNLCQSLKATETTSSGNPLWVTDHKLLEILKSIDEDPAAPVQILGENVTNPIGWLNLHLDYYIDLIEDTRLSNALLIAYLMGYSQQEIENLSTRFLSSEDTSDLVNSILNSTADLINRIESSPDHWFYLGDTLKRIEQNAERLAFRESNIQVDQQIYTEIAEELALIYESIPSLTAASVPYPYPSIEISVSADLNQQLHNGTYKPWNNLRLRFDGHIISSEINRRADFVIGHSEKDNFNHLTLIFFKPLNIHNLAKEIESTWDGVIGPVFIPELHRSNIVRQSDLHWYAFSVTWVTEGSSIPNAETRIVEVADDVVTELSSSEFISRIQYLNTNQINSLKAAPGDILGFASLNAQFSVIDSPETILETPLKFQFKDEQGDWTNFARLTPLHPDDFSREWRISVNYPYGAGTFTLPFTLEETSSRTKDVFGSRFRHPDNWIEQADLGWINDRKYPWLWHTQLGWLYLDEASSSKNAWWTYDRQLGWLWLPLSDLYPYIWANDRWLWYQEGSTHPRWFFDYKINQWISID